MNNYKIVPCEFSETGSAIAWRIETVEGYQGLNKYRRKNIRNAISKKFGKHVFRNISEAQAAVDAA